jgi:uncharacterized lipoprotein YddW (UPF0748 family)
MDKRQFLKTISLAGLTVPIRKAFGFTPTVEEIHHCAWIHPSKDESKEILSERYKSYRNAGIRTIYIEGGSEIHARSAKGFGIEAHHWAWMLNRGDFVEKYPHWYSISRDGNSCATKHPYVSYYNWLCPSREDVQEFLELEARKQLAKDFVDGYHLDYIRYCDVILPVNLWSTYKITQNAELPEYDFCYCDVCCSKFQKEYGQDIKKMEYPDQSPSWRAFRYNNITRLVNRIAKVAQEFDKPLTAAVFPTPEIAQRIVRQDWVNWNLNAVNPMIYHGFYRENVHWIGQAVKEGVRALNGKIPLYAGLYLLDFKNDQEIHQGIVNALHNGAHGVTIFSNPDQRVLDILKSATQQVVDG